MNNLACPHCGYELYEFPEHKLSMIRCPNCHLILNYCYQCGTFSVVHENLSDNELTNYTTVCRNCRNWTERAILKSEIYGLCNFAIKFVNSIDMLPYPMYFDQIKESIWKLPVGKIENNLGPMKNDFMYKDDLNNERISHWVRDAMDPGTSRAYNFSMPLEGLGQSTLNAICVTHETGLEIFLIALGVVAGAEIVKYSFSNIVDKIENNINTWFAKKTNEDEWWNKYKLKRPLVDHIKIRTTYWEISLDGSFSKEERLQILEYLNTHLTPQDNASEYLSDMSDQELCKKTLAKTRKVISRPINGIVSREHNSSEETITSILFLSADPSDQARLRLGEELREIQEKLQLAQFREKIKLAQRMSVRPEDISQALLDVKPDIVHFSGHGQSSGSLIVENQNGEKQPIQPDALASLFELFKEQVKCVLLNACYSAHQARAIGKHIRYVIGMNQAIGDEAAIAYAIGFYQALGAGKSIEIAHQFGCVQIRLHGIPEHLTPIIINNSPIL